MGATIPISFARGSTLSVLLLLAGCGEGSVYALYREGRFGGPHRVHVATFDAAESEEYNSTNCEYVARRIMADPGVTERYWCEKGRFHL